MKLNDKTILITAAGQGIGRASALACAAEGATVIAADINPETLATLSEEAPGIQTVKLDVTDPEAIQAFAGDLPDLDGLFNVAGFVHHGTILDVNETEWAFAFDLNVTSMYRMIRATLPGMRRRASETGTAAILNMSSMASSIKGFPYRCSYGATKAAVLGLTKSVAIDFVGEGIRVNALCPGTVDTPSLRGRIMAEADPVQAEKDFIARQPIGRLATVDDLTPLVVYLLSNDSSYVTGQAMSVDGGVTI